MFHTATPSATAEPCNRHAHQNVNAPNSLYDDSALAALVTVTELYCHNHDPSPPKL
ncbi:MAG: hypothetical protein JNN12_08010 [Bacteroidetes Order II. Incertae sedis bacterium]|nr:hypothetical protein [Bacteroidetes Order II. bacterium]